MTVYDTPVKNRLERLRKAVKPLGYVVLYKPLQKDEEFQLFREQGSAPIKRISKGNALGWTNPEWTIRHVVKRWEKDHNINKSWSVRGN